MRPIVCTFSMLKCVVVCAGFSEIYSSYLLHVEVCCCVQVSVRPIVRTFSMLKCVVVCAGFSEIYSSYLLHVEVCCCVCRFQ